MKVIKLGDKIIGFIFDTNSTVVNQDGEECLASELLQAVINSDMDYDNIDIQVEESDDAMAMLRVLIEREVEMRLNDVFEYKENNLETIKKNVIEYLVENSENFIWSENIDNVIHEEIHKQK